MNYFVNIVSMAIVFILFIFAFISCSDNNVASKNNEMTESTETETTLTTEMQPKLPEIKFDGYEFTVVNILYSIPIWTQRDIYAENQTGDIINDAVYIRNSIVEEKYDFTVVSLQVTDTIGTLNKFITSGDSTADIGTVPLNQFSSLATKGGLVEYSNIPYINLDAPWWDQSSVKNLSVINKLFAACSDLTIMDKDSTTAMVFNKKLVDDYSVENLYEIVKNGQWTLDMLENTAKLMHADVDGNGVFNDKDNYGLLYQRDTLTSFLSGCGGLIAEKDIDDLPVITLNSEKNMKILEDLFDFLYDKEICFHVMKFFDATTEGFTNGMTRMFQNNQAIFMWIRMADVENLRSMDTDFGILPIPKYTETQENYYHTVNPYVGTVIVVPQSADNLERIGIIIEALSAQSRIDLNPAYYDIMLNSKITRDNESLEMLNTIFNNRIYDIGDIFDFGGIGNKLITMTTTYNKNIVSVYDSNASKIEASVEKLVELYREIE